MPPFRYNISMLLGAVTYDVLKDWDLETIIKNLEAFGYEAVELRTGHKHAVQPSLAAAARERVTSRFDRTNVRLLCFGSTCDFQSPDPAERREHIQIGEQHTNLANATQANPLNG